MMQSSSGLFPWQQTIWRHLYAYIEGGRLPQALLLTGTSGLGKRHLAEIFASSLLCATPSENGSACGLCSGCKLFQAKTHPDYLLLEPDEPGKIIGIDKIRQLIAELALKPQFDRHRLVIFQPADMLNSASANAFLKCLEEPGERTCFILITEQPDKLPATIRSRCQIINCAVTDEKLAIDWLQQQGVTQDKEQLLKITQGGPLLAKHYADCDLMRLRREFFLAWLKIAKGEINVLLLAEHWYKHDNINLAVLINWLTSWVADTIRLAQGIDTLQIDNPDFKKSLQALAERLKLKQLYQYYDTLLMTRSQLTTQINKQLLTERLLIDWHQLNRH